MSNSEREQHLKDEEDRLRRTTQATPGIETCVVCDPDDESEKKDIITAFKQMFGDKPGYKNPTFNEENHPVFSFPKGGDAEDFFQKEAGSRRFIIIDAATKTVMGYSTGEDGILYHADGRPFKKGDNTLAPSNIPAKDFTLPSSGMRNSI